MKLDEGVFLILNCDDEWADFVTYKKYIVSSILYKVLYTEYLIHYTLLNTIYSYLNASTGSRFEALYAGAIPNTIPTTELNPNDNKIVVKLMLLWKFAKT